MTKNHRRSRSGRDFPRAVDLKARHRFPQDDNREYWLEKLGGGRGNKNGGGGEMEAAATRRTERSNITARFCVE